MPRRALTAALSLATASCLSSLHPRPGDTAPAGSWAIDPAFTMMTFSRDQAEVRRPDGGLQRRTGLGGEQVPVGGAFSFFTPEVGGRLGLTRRIEAGAQLGPMRQALELRLGLLSQRRGHGVSVALAQAAGYQPFADTRGLWLRGGLDASRWSGGTLVMANLHVSHGTEIHAFTVNVPAPPSNEEVADGPSPSASVRRVETRLLAALSIGRGGAMGPGDAPFSGGFFAFGLVPYWVLRARDLSRECLTCAPGHEVTRFSENFGISLVTHGTLQTWW